MRVCLVAVASLAIGIALGAIGGTRRSDRVTIAEGVIWSVEYKLENGQTGGFTRMNSSQAVPGHNGSWNVDARGRLTRDLLIITYPQRNDLGPHIIPTHRLVEIRFGEGGIKQVTL